MHPVVLGCMHELQVGQVLRTNRWLSAPRAVMRQHASVHNATRVAGDLLSLYRCALEKDPSRRPDAELMLHHPWVLHNLALRRRGVVCEPTPLRSLLCAEERRLLQSGTVVDQTGMRPQPRDEWGGHRSGSGEPVHDSELVRRESEALRDGVEAERRKAEEEQCENERSAWAHFKQAEAEFKQRRRNLVVANERERAKSASASRRRRLRQNHDPTYQQDREKAMTAVAAQHEQQVWQPAAASSEPLKVLQWGHRRWVTAPTIAFQGNVAESFAGW